MKVTRRTFCSLCLKAGSLSLLAPHISAWAGKPYKEALHYTKLANGAVRCERCPHGCELKMGQRGFCRVRENQDGTLVSLVYGLPCSVHVDPIEKKPFFHVLPATNSFSLATAGCNLRCKFCQNWQISQAEPEDIQAEELSGAAIAQLAERQQCPTIAYTYTEPTVFYEYIKDISEQASRCNIRSVMHSNGYINPEPLRELCQAITAANIDLKGFTNKYYQEVCSGDLETVLKSLVIIRKEQNRWLELTNLVIPGLNDNEDDIKRMAQWIRKNLGPEVPLHFSRFHPMYKLTAIAPTPVSTLEKARAIALQEGLQFVYIGNVAGHPAESTYCPKCKAMVIKRSGYTVQDMQLTNGSCRSCGTVIPGVWS